MKLTAVRSGQYVVTVNGVDVSTHTTEREAVESAVNREAANPGDMVEYRHDYVVRVEAAAKSVALSGQRVSSVVGAPRKSVGRLLSGGVVASARGNVVVAKPPVVGGLSGQAIVMNGE